MKRSSLLLIAMVALVSILVTACGGTAPTSSAPGQPTGVPPTTAAAASLSPVTKINTIRLVGTIGPLSIPLAYMFENNSLASVAEKTTFSTWATPVQ